MPNDCPKGEEPKAVQGSNPVFYPCAALPTIFTLSLNEFIVFPRQLVLHDNNNPNREHLLYARHFPKLFILHECI